MKSITFSILMLLTALGISAQSSYLTPAAGYLTTDLFPEHNFQVFDVYQGHFFGNDGTSVFEIDPLSGEQFNTFDKPPAYNAFPSFVMMMPGGDELIAGFTTTGNTDDRIYSIDASTGEWTLMAHFTASFDMVEYNGHLLASGLNSTNWGDPNAVFLVDESGNDDHRKIIDIGGYAAGITRDGEGSIYAGTSFATQDNGLFRWESSLVAAVIDNPQATPLTTENAEKISDIPAGAYDCDVDAAGNIIFNYNDFTGNKYLVKWNGTPGDGYHFDTLALATGADDWLGLIKSMGSISAPGEGNMAFTTSYGKPVAGVQRDFPSSISANKASTLRISPNPAADFVRIGFESADEVTLKISALNGKTVFESEKYYPGEKLRINFLDQGVYFITITGPDFVSSGKLIKL